MREILGIVFQIAYHLSYASVLITLAVMGFHPEKSYLLKWVILSVVATFVFTVLELICNPRQACDSSAGLM